MLKSDTTVIGNRIGGKTGERKEREACVAARHGSQRPTDRCDGPSITTCHRVLQKHKPKNYLYGLQCARERSCHTCCEAVPVVLCLQARRVEILTDDVYVKGLQRWYRVIPVPTRATDGGEDAREYCSGQPVILILLDVNSVFLEALIRRAHVLRHATCGIPSCSSRTNTDAHT